MTRAKEKLKAPKHLRAPTRRWWELVVTEYDLEEHHIKTLTVAAESWDRGQEARESLAKNGLTYLDRYGCPKTRPEIRIEATSKQLYMRAVRELGLDIASPEELTRPPATNGRGRR